MAQCIPDAEIIHISSHLLIDACGSPGILCTPNASCDASLLLNADASVEDDTETEKDKKKKEDAAHQTEVLLRSRSILTAAEISRMRLSASVVVLSFAHSSIVNPLSADEALENQRRLEKIVNAFLDAGAKSVVVSLYPG